MWRTEKLYRVDFILSAARSQFCEAKLASMVVLWLAGGKTVPYRFCFVGRTLPVLQGKTGEEYRLSASGKTISCRFSFVGRPLPVLRGKTGEYGRFVGGRGNCAVQILVLSAACF